MTGLNAINGYSNTLVDKLNKGGSFPFTPSEATYFLGVSGFVGAIIGPAIISRLGRKMNFLIGQGSMGVAMTLMGVFTVTEANMALFCFIVLYAILYQTSQGPLIWIYSSEVTVDAAGGLVVFAFFGALFLQAMTLNALMDSALQPQGVFFLFGGITILGFFWILAFMKDTTGLSDAEKKQLYAEKGEVTRVPTQQKNTL